MYFYIELTQYVNVPLYPLSVILCTVAFLLVKKGPPVWKDQGPAAWNNAASNSLIVLM